MKRVNKVAILGSGTMGARIAAHFANAGVPSYLLDIVPPDADVAAVGDAIARIVDMPFGKRPFRVHIDPTQDGAEVVNAVSDRVRAELLRRIGLGDLLTPAHLHPREE